MSRLPECPGPCNPKNRACRRACAQHFAALLEELPPCIRARLGADDIKAMCANDQREPRSPTYRDVSTSSKELEKKGRKVVEEPTRKEAPPSALPLHVTSEGPSGCATESSSDASASEQAAVGTTCQSLAEEEGKVTVLELEAETHTLEAETQTPGSESYAIAERLDSIRARAANISDAFKKTMSRLSWLARMLGITSAGCSCRAVNTLLYTGVLVFLARFARNTSFYELFLSSQICGVIVVVCWKISGRVPI